MINLETARDIQDDLVQYRRDIHANPELGFSEFETSKYICNILAKLNINYKIIGETGILANIIGTNTRGISSADTKIINININTQTQNTKKKCVALRAELDALPVVETTMLPYASKRNGIMHACGHDMHMAMLLGAATLLSKNKDEFSGEVLVIFQPAEEVLPGGAKMILESGAFDEYEPKYIFAQHINPMEESGKILVAPAESMASTNELFWKVTGKSSHAAQPHLGNDVILAAAHIINFSQNIITKYRNPLTPAVLSICSINGGNTTNIFPDIVEMKGVMRTFDEKYRAELENLIIEKSCDIARLYNCESQVEISRGYPAVINSKSAVNLLLESATKLFGKNQVFLDEPKLLAEDFAYFSQKYASCFYFIGANSKNNLTPVGLHNSSLNPDEEILYKGATLMAELAVSSLNTFN